MLQVLQLGASGSEVTLPSESRTVDEILYQEFVFEGRSANGTLHTDFNNYKLGWSISYGVLDQADLDTIKGLYELQFSSDSFLSFIYSDKSGSTTTKTVRMEPLSWANAAYLDDWYYNGVVITLREV